MISTSLRGNIIMIECSYQNGDQSETKDRAHSRLCHSVWRPMHILQSTIMDTTVALHTLGRSSDSPRFYVTVSMPR